MAALLTAGAVAAKSPADVALQPVVKILVPSGQFFTELGENGTGFGVRNYANGPRFLDAFDRYGGLSVMGFPSSRPWIWPGGFIYQLTQRALMQWSPADGKVRLANTYELLREAGLDHALYGRFIPRSEPDDSATFAEARIARMRWLTNPAITQAFVANPIQPGSVDAGIEFHGLPMSHPENFGPFVVQRFQRTAMQHWVEQVDGGFPVGTVVLINSGDHYKDLMLRDSIVAVPHTHSDARMVDLRLNPPALVDAELATGTERIYNVVDDVLTESLRLLEGVPSAAPALDVAATTWASIRFRSLPVRVVASFTPPSRISINRDLQGERLEAIAAVLAHELQHLSDFHDGASLQSEQDCLEAEIRAVMAESSVWSALVGPDGVATPQSVLERMENGRLRTVQAGEAAVRAMVEDLWGAQCDSLR